MNEWWVIRRQPVGESDWLVDLFTRRYGRLRAIVNGRQRANVNSRRRARADTDQYLPDLHQCATGEWVEKSGRVQIKIAETILTHSLTGNALICALYLEELMIRLLPEREPDEMLFVLYSDTLTALAAGQRADIWLRLFEQRLLTHCGYGFSWSSDANGHALHGSQSYRFIPGEGFVSAADGFSGTVLTNIAEGEFHQPGALAAARTILRQAIDALLTQPLVRRELLL